MKDIRAIRGKFYINNLISEGEHEHQDFKFAITDAAKIAHSISAFANNDGGRLLIGVKDNGHISGVRSEEDIYVIEQAATMYCRPAQKVDVTAFLCEGGAVVLRAEIMKADRRPVYSREADGKWRAYYRVKDENIAAHPLMVRSWERMAAGERLMFSLSEAESAILNHLEAETAADVETLVHAAGLSHRTAEDIIVRMTVAGILDFRYLNGRFMLVKTRT